VAKFVVENHYSWILQSFKKAMGDAEAGRFVDLHTALQGNLVVTVDIGSHDIYRA
jgi:glucose/arabinose dehydrogenase